MSALQATEAAPAKRAFTIKEACQISSIGRTRLYGEIKAGNLRARKCGRRTVILAEDLKSWLDSLEG